MKFTYFVRTHGFNVYFKGMWHLLCCLLARKTCKRGQLNDYRLLVRCEELRAVVTHLCGEVATGHVGVPSSYPPPPQCREDDLGDEADDSPGGEMRRMVWLTIGGGCCLGSCLAGEAQRWTAGGECFMGSRLAGDVGSIQLFQVWWCECCGRSAVGLSW